MEGVKCDQKKKAKSTIKEGDGSVMQNDRQLTCISNLSPRFQLRSFGNRRSHHGEYTGRVKRETERKDYNPVTARQGRKENRLEEMRLYLPFAS